MNSAPMMPSALTPLPSATSTSASHLEKAVAATCVTNTTSFGPDVLDGTSNATVRPWARDAIRALGVGRLTGILFGAATQLLFLYTAWNLYLFLRYGALGDRTFSPWIDGLLAIFFAWPHSLLLMPAVQRKIKQRIPAGLIGCIHCLATCVSLLFLFRYWSSSSWTLWDLKGWGEQGMLFFFYASWLALFYSLYLTGLGYQTGLTPWFYWMIRKAPPRRQFVESGAFRWMRHPVYMSFLGLIWFTPRMTLDHLILTLFWTAYIYVGSYLKDRRMTLFLGDVYRDYARRVTGFPLIGFGPWAKLR